MGQDCTDLQISRTALVKKSLSSPSWLDDKMHEHALLLGHDDLDDLLDGAYFRRVGLCWDTFGIILCCWSSIVTGAEAEASASVAAASLLIHRSRLIPFIITIVVTDNVVNDIL